MPGVVGAIDVVQNCNIDVQVGDVGVCTLVIEEMALVLGGGIPPTPVAGPDGQPLRVIVKAIHIPITIDTLRQLVSKAEGRPTVDVIPAGAMPPAWKNGSS